MRLRKFVDDMKLGRVTDTPEGCTAISPDLDKLESWVETVMRFNKGWCGSGTWGGITLSTKENCDQQVEGADPGPPLCPYEATSVFSSGIHTSRKTRSYWSGSIGGPHSRLGIWNISVMKKCWGSWACLSEEDIHAYKHLKVPKGLCQILLSGAQQQGKEQRL